MYIGPFQLHPSGSAGWTLSGEDLGKFGLEKAILTLWGRVGPLWTTFGAILSILTRDGAILSHLELN